MKETEYRAAEGISASDLKLFRRSPAHWLSERQHPREPSPAMKLGTAIHSAVLEPDKFDGEYIALPSFDRRTKAGKESAAAFEKENEGKTCLSEYEMAICRGIIGAVNRHPISAILKDQACLKEQSIFWSDSHTNVHCKARLDAMNPESHTVLEIKSTEDASKEAFYWSIYGAFGYWIQAIHYSYGYLAKYGSFPRFIFVAIEKSRPYGISLFELDAEFWSKADPLYNSLLLRADDCIKFNHFPAYSQDVQIISTPKELR